MDVRDCPCRTPHLMQMEMILERSERPFALPSARVEAHHVCSREYMRITPIGQRAIMAPMQPEWDQAHRRPGLVVRSGSQRDDRIEHPIGLRTEVRHVSARLTGVPTDPPHPLARKRIKEGKAEGATITEHQSTGLHAFPQGQHMRHAVSASSRPAIHAHPWWQTHRKQRAHLACQEARVSPRKLAQPGQKARQWIQGAGIGGGDRSGPRSEATIFPRGQTGPQPDTHVFKEPWQRRSRSCNPMRDGLIAHLHRRKAASLLRTPEPPDVPLRVPPAQQAEHHGQAPRTPTDAGWSPRALFLRTTPLPTTFLKPLEDLTLLTLGPHGLL
ncbi:MAG TPA: hypothetical protein VGF67_12860 [Ktedonobacteraceae bacterium]